MHILSVFSTDILGGIASHIVGLAKRLTERGHKVTLMTRGYWRGKREFNYEGFRVIKVLFYPLYPFHVYFHGYFVRKAIESLSPQPDLIHLHSPLVPPIPKKWPIVTTFHSPMLLGTANVESFGLQTFLIKLMGRTTSYQIERKLLKISDAIITVSQGVADELRTYYGFTGNHLYPISNVIDTAFYKPASQLPKERKLLYIGRLCYGKGLFELAKSAKLVIKEYPDVKYTLIGAGPLEKKLRETVNKLGLDSNFELCGEVRNKLEIVKHYQQAYAVLIPSYYEGCPMVLLEAMACGKPIIAATAGFERGILDDGINAILVKPKSVEELSRATLQILCSKELCEKLGKAARNTAVEKMNPEINTNQVEEVYGRATERWRQTR